jgi:hypothetical protein
MSEEQSDDAARATMARWRASGLYISYCKKESCLFCTVAEGKGEMESLRVPEKHEEDVFFLAMKVVNIMCN